MTHTDRTTVLATALKDKIYASRFTLGINQVIYGAHNMISLSPAVVVSSARKRKDLAGVAAPGGRTRNFMDVNIDVLTNEVGDEDEMRLRLEQLSESIETFLDADTTVGGIIIHGFVTEWQPVDFIQNSQWRAVRLIFTGQTKTYLSA